MTKRLGIYYGRSIAIIFGTVFFVLFGDCKNLFFDEIFFRTFFYLSSFYPKSNRIGSRKTAMTQEWLVMKCCSIFRWVAVLILYWLVENILSHLNEMILTWNTYLQLCQKVSHQNSRLVNEICVFLKQAVSVIHFLDLLIVIGLLLWNCKDWKCAFWVI